MLAVATSSHASVAALTGAAALSPGLRTSPLPATHAWVGYGWQNNRLYHFFKVLFHQLSGKGVDFFVRIVRCSLKKRICPQVVSLDN